MFINICGLCLENKVEEEREVSYIVRDICI